MRAGGMIYQLEIREPVYEPGAGGSQSVAYRSLGMARAERVRLSGRRVDEVGEHFADYTAAWRVRASVPCKENWRLHEPASDILYSVTHIEPERRIGSQVIYCERVNE